ncbi:MAG: hypothetical protein RMI99_02995 [Nitrososphaerota archaeon]|nr:hypothetical protein [Candidatus Nezhaarchaeota archaeon]MDW8050029.1 hypothetical protein [Nitrososphaerota archaeon]
MSDSINLLKTESIQKVVNTLKSIGVDRIEPTIEFNEGVRYPILDKIVGSPKDVMEALLILHESNILSSELVDNIIVCPFCQSHKLMIRGRCPSCNSSKLIRNRMLEHLACGHVDFEEEFRVDGKLICPKCRKPLEGLDVDYRIFSFVYKCLKCEMIFSKPKMEYLCSNEHLFDDNNLSLYKVIAFKVSPEKISLIEKLALDLKAILKPLIDEGFTVKIPAIIQGRSGVKHDFSFAVWHNNNSSPIAVGFLQTPPRATSSIDVLAFWAKTSDVGVEHKVMITFSGIDEEAKNLARVYNIEVIEGIDEREVANKIKDQLAKKIKEESKRRSTT